MSQENVELLRRGMEEINRVGISEVNPRLYYHPDVEYSPLRAATEGEYRGIAGIERFNAAGNIIQEYVVAGETCFRGVALDPTGTAFFASNYCNSHIYKFDLRTGIVLMSFTAASPGFTVKTVAVQKSNVPEACWTPGFG